MVAPILLAGLAVLILVGLAAWRVYRVRSGADPQPEGVQLFALFAFLLFVPPLILQIVLNPKASGGQMDGVASVAFYAGTFIVLWLAMWVAALLVARFAPPERRPLLLLALVGRETSMLVPFDPPMTGAVAEQVALVDQRNAEFPRGAAFMQQVDQAGFRSNWDGLDTATRALEGSIAEAGRLGTGIAKRALETAADARGRLDTLRRDAAAHGQGWAT